MTRLMKENCISMTKATTAHACWYIYGLPWNEYPCTTYSIEFNSQNAFEREWFELGNKCEIIGVYVNLNTILEKMPVRCIGYGLARMKLTLGIRLDMYFLENHELQLGGRLSSQVSIRVF